MLRLGRYIALGCLAAGIAPAADNAIGGAAAVCHSATLRNGFSIQYVRSEVDGSSTRLWLSAGQEAGYVIIPTEQIDHFEQWQDERPAAVAHEIAPVVPVASPAPSAKVPVKTLISNVALKHRIDPDFVASVVKAESGFNPDAVSPKGARGLMQLMPRTAASLGVGNSFDPAANMEGGTKYLRQLLDEYGGDAARALAAYNAGPQRVTQYGGVPPYAETRAYVARIINDYNRKKLQQQSDSLIPSASK